jgi:hypothetical protein
MIKVSKNFLEVMKKHNLAYDGTFNPPKSLNRQVRPLMGRTYKITKHNIYVTDGYNGIYDIVQKIIEKG